jgi:hypothetical protein
MLWWYDELIVLISNWSHTFYKIIIFCTMESDYGFRYQILLPESDYETSNQIQFVIIR